MEIWVATSNQGKLNEFRNILEPIGYTIHSQGELKVFSPPPETGSSFEENARIKARALRSVKSDDWVIADDSGLEVEGLNMLPGIHSARYAGDKASDAENNAKLLKMMSLRSARHRAAQFRCTMIAYSPDGTEYKFEGVLKGEIASKPAGASGFGYDPLFVAEGHQKTLAEARAAEKNKISHRAQAIRQFREVLSKDSNS